MTTAVETPADAPADIPEGTKPVKLVLCVEGMDTSDGRYIEPGALQTRPMPLGLYAQVRSTHGADGDAATWNVGSITNAYRVPGAQVNQLSTGEPFPDGSFVWLGEGWMYTDVPTPDSGSKSAYVLVKDKALRGNSVDLAGVDAEFEYAADAGPGDPPERIVMHAGYIASTTLVGIPAFMDAFVELDGEVIATDEFIQQEALAAGGALTPSWRSADVGDACSPCLANDAAGLAALAEVPSPLAPTDSGARPAAAEQDYSTSGMVALLPANPTMLLAPGGDPADQLHLTLAFLGDEVDQWDADQVAAVQQLALEATDRDAMADRLRADAMARGDQHPEPVGAYSRSPAQEGPLTANVFSHAVFNPNGDKAATVYQFDGTGQREAIDWLRMDLVAGLRNALGTTTLPDQHEPYVPHVTAGYGLPVDQLTYTGPVVFDRLRVAIGNTYTDYPLGGGQVLTASAGVGLPPASWFTDPKLTEPTAATVLEDGRAFGHLACWDSCHIGFQGQCVQPPHNSSGYAGFLVHSTRVADAAGNVVTVPVGWGTVDTSHAGLSLSAMDAASHYDNTGTVAFEFTVGEDEHGIWFAGRLMPGLDELTEHKARGVAFSGDWRAERGSLELVAALGVPVPGFQVPRVRVASGAPVALVAGGVVVADTGGPVDGDGPHGARRVLGLNDEEMRSVIAWVNAQRLTSEQAAALAELDVVLGPHEADAGPIEQALAEVLADIELAEELGHPWWLADLDAGEDGQGTDDAVLTAAGQKVLHLPPFIKRISKHLRGKGMAESRAIATAVNAAKKMCATGDLNFPGHQDVNPGSKAEACKAVVQWKADRPGSKG